MIVIREVEKIDKSLEDFQKQEWVPADLAHFGREIDWSKKYKIYTASDDGKLVGVLELCIQAGVMHVEALIVKHDKYGQGVGKQLMSKAEALAEELKLHKIYLGTGKTWDATKFYEALGYNISGELPNHFEHQTYVVYQKLL